MATEMDISAAIEYINGRLNETEKLQFEQWLRESDQNIKQFETFKKYWELSGRGFNEHEANIEKGWNIVDSITEEKANVKSRKFIFTGLKIAASIAIIVALSFIVKISFNSWQQKDLITYHSDAQKSQIVLPDSSVVWLNAHSSIQAPKEFKGNFRNVILTGEAFFEIRKNPVRPFIVKAEKTFIEVLGTSFNVNEKNNTVSVSVLTGKVAFYSSKRNNLVMLIPGQKCTYDINNKTMTWATNANNNFMAWKTGKLEFKDAGLTEMCSALEEYYNIKILKDSHAGDQQYLFTGTIDNSPCDEALKTIGLTLGIKFEKIGKEYKISY